MTKDAAHRPDRPSLLNDPRLGAAALAVSVVALGAAVAPWLTGLDFDSRVRTYLLDNPEVLQEMLQAQQAREQQAGSQAITAAAAADPALLAHDPRDPAVGPPADQAAVTVVQFFDYRCPGCKSVAPGVLALIQANPDVRFVFKEWPILDRGEDQTSRYAAQAALAAHAQGRYLPVHQALMAEPALDAQAVDRVLTDNGVDLANARGRMEAGEHLQQVAHVHEIARRLGLMGTPTFIVNGRATDGIAPAELDAAIQAARDAAGQS